MESAHAESAHADLFIGVRPCVPLIIAASENGMLW